MFLPVSVFFAGGKDSSRGSKGDCGRHQKNTRAGTDVVAVRTGKGEDAGGRRKTDNSADNPSRDNFASDARRHEGRRCQTGQGRNCGNGQAQKTRILRPHSKSQGTGCNTRRWKIRPAGRMGKTGAIAARGRAS